LYEIGGKALFLKELEEKLLANEADIAVHSLKDVPAILPDNLKIAAVLEREDARDCLVSYKYKSLEELPEKGTIGFSSIRRKVLMKKFKPGMRVVQIRGNIDTRLLKLKEHNAPDGMLLACAGLKRIGLFDESFCTPLSASYFIPAPCQGIIAVEIRSDDSKMADICDKINHLPTWHLAQAEREFLIHFNASCDTPIGAYAYYINANNMKIDYMYGVPEGRFLRFHVEVGAPDEVKEMAERAVTYLKSY